MPMYEVLVGGEVSPIGSLEIGIVMSRVTRGPSPDVSEAALIGDFQNSVIASAAVSVYPPSQGPFFVQQVTFNGDEVVPVYTPQTGLPTEVQ